MAEEKKPAIYATGLYFKQKEVKGSTLISMNVRASDFIAFLNEHTNEDGFVNIDIWPSTKEGSKFSHNAQLNTWKPDATKSTTPAPTTTQTTTTTTTASSKVDDDLPF